MPSAFAERFYAKLRRNMLEFKERAVFPIIRKKMQGQDFILHARPAAAKLSATTGAIRFSYQNQTGIVTHFVTNQD